MDYKTSQNWACDNTCTSFQQYLTRKLLIHLSLTKLFLVTTHKKNCLPNFRVRYPLFHRSPFHLVWLTLRKNVLQMYCKCFFSLSFSPLFHYSPFFHSLKYFPLLSIFLHYFSTFYFRGNLAILWNLTTVVLLFKCKCILIFKEKKAAQCACLSSIQVLKSQVISWMVKQ